MKDFSTSATVKTVKDVTYAQCADLCTGRADGSVSQKGKSLIVTAKLPFASQGGSYNCKSFTYTEASKTCGLSDDLIKPQGRADAVATPGTTYNEKHCFNGQLVYIAQMAKCSVYKWPLCCRKCLPQRSRIHTHAQHGSGRVCFSCHRVGTNRWRLLRCLFKVRRSEKISRENLANL